MSSLFLITSAINTKFGVFSSSLRLGQTIQTIESIRDFLPEAKLVLLEMSAIPLDNEQKQVLKSKTDFLWEFYGNNYVQKVFQDNRWSVVKNLTEIKCFQLALLRLLQDSTLDNIHRVYKISGRYRLNQSFDPKLHVADKICISERRPSELPLEIPDIPFAYMSRLWSWPAEFTPIIEHTFSKGFNYVSQQIDKGLYCDIEHMLYKYLPENLVTFIEPIGVEGRLGPNGELVKD